MKFHKILIVLDTDEHGKLLDYTVASEEPLESAGKQFTCDCKSIFQLFVEQRIVEPVIEYVIKEEEEPNVDPSSSEEETKSYFCSYCGRKCRSLDALHRHEERIHLTVDDEPPKYSCDHCSKVFKSKWKLKLHLSRHASNRTKDFICEHCAKPFFTSAALNAHLETHEPKQRFECVICHREFNRERHCRAHMNIVHYQLWRKSKNTTKEFECEFEGCGKSFTYRYKLAYHQRQHTGERNFGCSVCFKRFATPDLLKSHGKRMHEAGAMFECSTCGAKIKYQSNYDNHLKLHRGESVHTCDVCSKTFSRANNLKRHKDVAHENKRFTCSTCGKAIHSKHSLMIHERTHSGVKPYSCPCGRFFNDPGFYRRHCNKHHKDDANV